MKSRQERGACLPSMQERLGWAAAREGAARLEGAGAGRKGTREASLPSGVLQALGDM